LTHSRPITAQRPRVVESGEPMLRQYPLWRPRARGWPACGPCSCHAR